MSKKEIMQELLDRYEQYHILDEKNNSARTVLELYILKLENKLKALL